MTFHAAVIEEQDLIFAVVIVKKSILENKDEADKAVEDFQTLFCGMPAILMAQDSQGIPTYHGRPDIVEFMANVPLELIKWQEYSPD